MDTFQELCGVTRNSLLPVRRPKLTLEFSLAPSIWSCSWPFELNGLTQTNVEEACSVLSPGSFFLFFFF